PQTSCPPHHAMRPRRAPPRAAEPARTPESVRSQLHPHPEGQKIDQLTVSGRPNRAVRLQHLRLRLPAVPDRHLARVQGGLDHPAELVGLRRVRVNPPMASGSARAAHVKPVLRHPPLAPRALRAVLAVLVVGGPAPADTGDHHLADPVRPLVDDGARLLLVHDASPSSTNGSAPCINRLAAISQYRSLISTPIALRLSIFAATRVDPDPVNGSATTPAGHLEISSSISDGGFGVGWSGRSWLDAGCTRDRMTLPDRLPTNPAPRT